MPPPRSAVSLHHQHETRVVLLKRVNYRLEVYLKSNLPNWSISENYHWNLYHSPHKDSLFLIFKFIVMDMNVQFTTSSRFLKDIPATILSKRDVIKLKMQRYKDVKVYLYSFILPDYMTDEYVSGQLDALASHILFPYLILSIANATIYNPRLVAKNVNGIVYIYLCFEHE